MRLTWRAACLALTCALASAPALATVTTSTRSVSYSPSVNTSVFTVTYPFLAASHLTVTKILDATLAETTLVNGVDYTVRLPVGTTNGYITTTVAVTSAYSIRIDRTVPLTQATSFKTQGAFRPASHEEAFDKLTMIAQQLQSTASGDIDQADIDTSIATHAGLSDPHTGYLLLAGRAGGQTANGGTAASENLVLRTTTHGTKGKILMGSAGTELVLDDVNNRVGIGTASPSVPLQVTGDVNVNTGAAGGGLSFDDGYLLKLVDNDYMQLFGCTAASAATCTSITLAGPSAAGPNSITIAAATYSIGDIAGNTFIYADDATSTILLSPVAGTTALTLTSGAMTGATGFDIALSTTSFVQVPTVQGSTASGGDLTLLSTTHGTKGDIFLGTTSTYSELNSRLGINILAPTVALDVVGAGQFTTTVTHLRKQIAGGASYTVVAPTDCGATVETATDNAIITLPDAASANDGCQVLVRNTGADGAALISVQPHSSDGINGSCVGITGAGAATIIQSSGTNNKAWNNTKATANQGDYVVLESDGSADWWINDCIGEWASTP